ISAALSAPTTVAVLIPDGIRNEDQMSTLNTFTSVVGGQLSTGMEWRKGTRSGFGFFTPPPLSPSPSLLPGIGRQALRTGPSPLLMPATATTTLVEGHCWSLAARSSVFWV